MAFARINSLKPFAIFSDSIPCDEGWKKHAYPTTLPKLRPRRTSGIPFVTLGLFLVASIPPIYDRCQGFLSPHSPPAICYNSLHNFLVYIQRGSRF